MHVPVLLKETLEYLNPKPHENFIDCTFGFGGHSLAILEKNKPDGKVLGIEQDKEVLKNSPDNKRLIIVESNFNKLKKIVEENDFGPVNGILLDLGISSWHFDKSNKGFSFKTNEPLDMNCQGVGPTAQDIINQYPEGELVRIFKEYGQERFPGRIARAICQERKKGQIKTTGQLVDLIKKVIPRKYTYSKIHFATKVFQALRIEVNDELNNLKKVLPQTIDILEKGGRLVVISFHSLEDRIIKNFFKDQFKNGQLEILTKKPIRPEKEEINLNNRSRSAKLRASKKI